MNVVKTTLIGLCNITIGHEVIESSPGNSTLMFVARMEMPVHHAMRHREMLPMDRLLISTGLNDWEVAKLEDHLDENAYDDKAVCFFERKLSMKDEVLMSDRDAVWESHAAMMVKAMELTLAAVSVSISVIE